MRTPATAGRLAGEDASGTALLRARDLRLAYRQVVALAGVDLDLRPGESLALVGPNGAGKTSLLSILAGLTRPDSGSLEWRDAARQVGWVPQSPGVYRRLTVRENLRLFARLEGRADPDAVAADLIARADLGAAADRLAGDLSTGMLQRVNLGVALAGEPALLLLDEPSATLSPELRARLWRWLDELRRERGMGLVFSTQFVDEAIRHGDRLQVLVAGRTAFAGTPRELIGEIDIGGDRMGAAEAAFLRLIEPG